MAHREAPCRGPSRGPRRRRLACTVSMPFYRAGADDSYGLKRRRQVMVDRRKVIAVADDLFGGDSTTTFRAPGCAEGMPCSPSSNGPGRVRCSTSSPPSRPSRTRSPCPSRAQLIAVQGGPGTGKTAVGLHRAAFLLYNHPALSRAGVLVIGPSRAFLRYISQVLPSLGEEAVIQTTIADIAPRPGWIGEDPLEVRRLKGDLRMAEVLAADLPAPSTSRRDRRHFPARFASCVVPAEVHQRAGGLHRRHPGALQSRPGGAALRAWSAWSGSGSGRRAGSRPTNRGCEREVSTSELPRPARPPVAVGVPGGSRARAPEQRGQDVGGRRPAC